MRRGTGKEGGSGEDAEPSSAASDLFANGGSSRSRLAASSRLDSGQLTKALAGDYTPTDAWQDLGGSRESEQFNMRIIALSDPEHYAALRTDAMKEVKDATEKAFMTAYKQF